MKRTHTAIAALAVIASVLTAEAEAQREGSRRPSAAAQVGRRNTGLMVGVHTLAAMGVEINGEEVRDDFHTELGGGIGAMIGYGFTPALSAYASIDVAKQGSGMDDLQGNFGLMHFEVGARANLPVGTPRTTPYITASAGARALGARVTDFINDEEYDASFSGSMFAIGAGVEHSLTPTTSLDGGVQLGFGSFGKLAIDGDEDSIEVEGSRTVRLRLGVLWRP